LDVVSDLLPEEIMHHMLVSGTRVFQAKRHDLVTENTIQSDEGHLLLVSFLEFYLVVTRISIQEGKPFAPHG
jgi:hypothetical protein